MITTKYRIIATVLLLSAFARTHAQERKRTIPENLAQEGQSLYGMSTVPSGPPLQVEKVLAEADLIVRGTVGTPRSYLSDDQTEVRTEYPILNPALLYQSAGAIFETPGMPTVTVTLHGGTIQINGLTYTFEDKALPRLDPGTECVLLLKRVGSTYEVAGGHYGAFRITNGKIAPLTRKQGFAPEYQNAPVDQAVAQLVSQRRSIKR